MSSSERDLEVALAAAALAADLIRNDYEDFVPIPDAPVEISTATDRGAQEIILQYLRQQFPGDSLCAEEATETLAGAAHAGHRLWVVDPIDGTRGFATKCGEFSVMIGLLIDGELAVGVVDEPIPKRVTYARRGAGCWVSEAGGSPRRCHVSTVPTLREATLIQSHSKRPGIYSNEVKALKPAKVVEVFSAGVKLALVARGEGELYLNTYSKFHDWDICAGHLLVTEAGGMVTRLLGDPITYGSTNFTQDGGLLATNGAIHAEAAAILTRLASSSGAA